MKLVWNALVGLIILTLILSFQNILAEDSKDDIVSAEPKEYTVGVYLLNVGKIDLQTGSYDLDFYLWFKSEDDNFIENPPKFEFMNGRATIDQFELKKIIMKQE